MVSRAVGAAALFVLAASSAFAQPGRAGMGGMTGFEPGMPADSGVPAPGVPASVDPILGSGSSSLFGGSGFSRFWFDGGYQAGYIRNVATPSLIATQGGAFAVRGTPGTSVALGGGEADLGVLHGGRFRGGFWLDSNRAFGLEASVFFLAEQSETIGVSGGGAALSRPFFDTSIQAQNVRILNLPGQVAGSVTSETRSLFWAADLGPVIRVIETEMLTLDQLLYFRYATLEESQTVSDSVSPIGGAITFRGQAFRGAGSAVSVRDQASVINRFYGGGAGLRLGITPGRFFANVEGKLAVGSTRQSLRLEGTTTLTGAGDTQTANGGLLVPATSNGTFARNEFSFLPEVGVKLGFQITQNIGVYAGYNFLYMTNVGRPGENFTNNINPTQLPSSQNFGVPFGPNSAPVRLNSTDFWMHTVGVGLNIKY